MKQIPVETTQELTVYHGPTCDWCDKPVWVNCGFVTCDLEHIEILACEEHYSLAKSQQGIVKMQDMARMWEKVEERRKSPEYIARLKLITPEINWKPTPWWKFWA